MQLMIDLTAFLPTIPQTSPYSLNGALTSSLPIQSLKLSPPPLSSQHSQPQPLQGPWPQFQSQPPSLHQQVPPGEHLERAILSSSSSTSLITLSPSSSSDNNTPSSQPYAW
ncbi:hypothetical protein L873DRAFT_1801668 [Choiromyces venosus 120613-1]|uniref:Uncharacterized protein n=1 Tax=Choiromyces venosus 120613-1 TaxID=1336337 RepID=A0A3N4JWG6_9PEZI|nr:hypothetical protein L873DRAFT_1801668 [Choiromyces venosus 120613-1]